VEAEIGFVCEPVFGEMPHHSLLGDIGKPTGGPLLGRQMTSVPCRRVLKVRSFILLPLVLGASAAVAAPSPTILDYRHHMFEGPMMSLANRTIEMMFDTARVDAGARAAPLTGHSLPPDFTYDFEGRTHPAEDVLERTATDALLIMKDGRIVYEKYLNRAAADTHFISYSMAKTFNSIMLGFAIRDGAVRSVADPLIKYVPELKGSAYDGTTLRDLLRMRSGTDWNDNFFVPGPAKDINEQAFIRNEARYVSAAAWPMRKSRPGTAFNYNTVDAALIGLVIERATGKPISRYMSERLWRPAGMQSYAFYVLDGPPGVGREFTGGGFNAVLRDYGRVGQLMLNEGMANGQRLLDPAWIRESTADSDPATSARPGLGYGYFWWTLKGTRAYVAIGGEGQFLFVDPDTRTVIVKLSHAAVGPGSEKITDESLAFFRAASAWKAEGGR